MSIAIAQLFLHPLLTTVYTIEMVEEVYTNTSTVRPRPLWSHPLMETGWFSASMYMYISFNEFIVTYSARDKRARFYVYA